MWDEKGRTNYSSGAEGVAVGELIISFVHETKRTDVVLELICRQVRIHLTLYVRRASPLRRQGYRDTESFGQRQREQARLCLHSAGPNPYSTCIYR